MDPAKNIYLTNVNPGSPMGSLLRSYWIPLLYSHELAECDGPPRRIRLLGESLVAFRDTEGRVGLLDHHCPHRLASLFYGRNEEGGLRCAYHGWKFDASRAPPAACLASRRPRGRRCHRESRDRRH
jgi:nitrite reductase/ring-hydroxylating ferredoxin subunit